MHTLDISKIYLYSSKDYAKVILDVLFQEENKTPIIEIELDGLEELNKSTKELLQLESLEKNNQLIIANKNNHLRKEIGNFWNGNFKSIIHPKAYIANTVSMQNGSIIMPNAIINCGVVIGKNVIISAASIVEFDCTIHDYVYIASSVVIANNVVVEEGTTIGINSSIIEGLHIGKWVTIKSGSVVLQDVPDNAIIDGNPGVIIGYNKYIS